MTSLRLADVTFSYDDCEGPIVENFSYELDEGTISLISGPSGCGKSTVFKLMAGLLPQYGGKILSGKVLLENAEIESVVPFERAKRVAMLFQNPNRQFAMKTVFSQFVFALENLQLDHQEIEERINDALKRFELEDFKDRNLQELSGGEQQRIALALVYSLKSPVILLDEPFANVDPENRSKLLEDLKRLHVMTGKDLSKEEAFAWDDSKIVIFVRDSSKSGEWLYQELLLKYHLQLEMASGDYALAMTSIMDQEEGYQRLSAALHEIDRELCGADTAKKQQVMNEKKVRYGNETDGSMENMYEQQVHRGSFIKEVYRPNPQQMQIYEAEEKETAEVSFDEAAGRISADFIFLYPPGIPLIVPGEAITAEFIERLRTCISLKLNLQGSTDLFAERIKIVYF